MVEYTDGGAASPIDVYEDTGKTARSHFDGGREITLTHVVEIRKSSGLIVPQPSLPQYTWNYSYCDELKEWLEGRVFIRSYRGGTVLLHMTEQDAVLFKLFFY
jgi:hypothetical protein